MEARHLHLGDGRVGTRYHRRVVIEPRTLRQVDFRFRSRGYNPDDVDDFLERLAIGLETLHRQIEAVGDVTPKPEAPPPVDPSLEAEMTEAGMRRMLQRSQAEADELVRVAREEAAKQVAEAEARAAEIVEKAPETLPVYGQAQELHQELLELQARRNSLWAHLVAFEQLLVEQTPLIPSAGTPPPRPVDCMHLFAGSPVAAP